MCSVGDEWPINSKGYKLISALGSGYFGIVWRAEICQGLHLGEHVAIKKIDLERYGDNKIEDIRKNMLLLNLLDHQNILSYKIAFLNKQELWLVSELMEGGSIEKIIHAIYPNGIKDQALIATIIKETLLGIQYLHNNSQIHRDIKAGNILIGANGCVKISDFGVTTKLNKGKKRKTLIGSPCYMAPEILDHQNKKGYDSKVDIWSLGITALELAIGRPPNSDLTTMKLILKTLNDEPPKLPKEPYWDNNFYEFIEYCLVKDPLKRKTSDEIFKLCKGFFSKAKGKEYIKEKILKNLPPLDARIDELIKQTALEQMNVQSKCPNLAGFDFSCLNTSISKIDTKKNYGSFERINFNDLSISNKILPSDILDDDEEQIIPNKNTESIYNHAHLSKSSIINRLKGDVNEFSVVNEEES